MTETYRAALEAAAGAILAEYDRPASGAIDLLDALEGRLTPEEADSMLRSVRHYCTARIEEWQSEALARLRAGG